MEQGVSAGSRGGHRSVGRGALKGALRCGLPEAAGGPAHTPGRRSGLSHPRTRSGQPLTQVLSLRSPPLVQEAT